MHPGCSPVRHRGQDRVATDGSVHFAANPPYQHPRLIKIISGGLQTQTFDYSECSSTMWLCESSADFILQPKIAPNFSSYVFSWWLVHSLALQIIRYDANVKVTPSVTVTNKIFSNIQKSFCIAWLRIQHLVETTCYTFTRHGDE